MKRGWFFLGVAAQLFSCAPPPAQKPFPIELYVAAGLNDQLSGFQLSVIKNGSTLDCVAAQKFCIKDQVDADRFVWLKGNDGRDVRALTVPLALAAGSVSTQDVSLRELPLGKDLALIVEALSKESPPTLVGSACHYIKELTAGSNATVVARIEPIAPAPACDPRQ